MKVGGHDQYPVALLTFQASFRIARLVPRGESVDRADRDRRGLRKALHVSLRELALSKPIDLRRRGNIDHHPPPVALSEQLQRTGRALLRLPGKNQNHIRLFRRVQHQHPPRVRRRQCHEQYRRPKSHADPDTPSSTQTPHRLPSLRENSHEIVLSNMPTASRSEKSAPLQFVRIEANSQPNLRFIPEK